MSQVLLFALSNSLGDLSPASLEAAEGTEEGHLLFWQREITRTKIRL
jgi:hypothetical protein